MTFEIVSENGSPIEDSVRSILQKVIGEIQNNGGKILRDSLLHTTRRHVQTIYPDSTHYSPSHITPVQYTNGATPTGEINIDIPGITRAYHDMLIKPVKANHLTIPMHQDAYGKRVRDFDNLFRPKGKNALARKNSDGSLTWMFALADQAFQHQDERLMPTDETFADNILARISAMLHRSKVK